MYKDVHNLLYFHPLFNTMFKLCLISKSQHYPYPQQCYVRQTLFHEILSYPVWMWRILRKTLSIPQNIVMDRIMLCWLKCYSLKYYELSMLTPNKCYTPHTCYKFISKIAQFKLNCMGLPYDRGEPVVSYKWTGWVWELTGWSSRLQENYRSFQRNL